MAAIGRVCHNGQPPASDGAMRLSRLSVTPDMPKMAKARAAKKKRTRMVWVSVGCFVGSGDRGR
jgi:hypothetical protein